MSGYCPMCDEYHEMTTAGCCKPSRRVVEPPNTNTYPVDAIHAAYRNGYAACQREAVEAVEKLAESHHDINVNAENGWVKLSVIIAAISALEVKP